MYVGEMAPPPACYRDGMFVASRVVHRRALYSSLNLFVRSNYDRWITDIDHTVGISRISSGQNGLLLAGISTGIGMGINT